MAKAIVKKSGFRSLEGDLLVGEINIEGRPLPGPGEAIWLCSGLTEKDFINAHGLQDGDVLVTSVKEMTKKEPPDTSRGKISKKKKEEEKKEKPPYTAILHVVVPLMDSLSPSEQYATLRTLYFNILKQAVAMDAKVIVLPFLGIKSREIPIQTGIDVALNSIHDFLEENNYKEFCIKEIILFTTDGQVSAMATTHDTYKKPIMKGKLAAQDKPDQKKYWNCIGFRLRDAKPLQEQELTAKAPCSGLMHSLSTMTFNGTDVLPDGHSDNRFFGASHEADLIMSRIGEFNVDWTHPSSNSLEICNHHLDRLSRDWSNPYYKNLKYRDNKLVCSFPEHDGFLRPRIKTNAATVEKEDAIRWMKKKGTVIQPGIPICDAEKEFLRSSEFDSTAASQDTLTMESLMELDNDDDLGEIVQQLDEKPLILKKTPSTAEQPVKEAALNLLRVLNCGSITRKKDWKYLSPRQKRNKLNILRIVVDAMCEVISPEAKEELKALLLSGNIEEDNIEMMPFKNMLTEAADLFYRAESKKHRICILSTVASLGLPLLRQFIPGLTKHMYQKAQRFAKNPVASAERRIIRERWDQKKVDRLLGFLLSPLVVLNLPFNERTFKMDDGSVSHLPNFMRLQNIEEVYRMYREFLIEQGEKDLLLKESTAKEIIRIVAPTRRKNLTCVDEKIGEGMKAYDELFDMVSDLERRGFIIKDISNELTRMLQHSKAYLRGDFKTHISQFSSCADHCATFALSDSKENRLSIDCESLPVHAHKHDSLCDRCELVNASIDELREALQDAENTTADASERDHFRWKTQELDVCKSAIVEMKRHQVRSAVSHGERAEFVEQLTQGIALVTLDWAQKFEPMHAREKQSDYYAKSGIGYHIAHGLTVIDGKYAEHTSVHIVGPGVPQDGAAVAMITESFLLELKEMGIHTCIIRSDNAGCYRNGPLMRSLIDMQDKIGVRILGCLYSEAQAGKSACDRGSARVKRKTRDDIAAKRTKVDTKETFFDILTTGTLLNGVSIHLCDISGVKKVNSQIPKITSYSSFSFEASGILIRKHRSIGEGVLYDFKKLKPCIGSMTIKKSGGFTTQNADKFWITRDTPEDKAPAPTVASDSTPNSISRMYSCSEETCIDEFTSFRELKKHLIRDKHTHKLERKTLRDYCAKTISTSLDTHFSIDAAKLKIAIEKSIHNGPTELCEGWALRTIQQRNHNDEPARKIIRDYFKMKRGAGLKCNPHEAEVHMKTHKLPNGKLQISPPNRLSISQIKTLINGLLKKERDADKKVEIVEKKSNEEDSEDDDEDHYEEENDEEELSELVRTQLEFAKDDAIERETNSDDETPAKKIRK